MKKVIFGIIAGALIMFFALIALGTYQAEHRRKIENSTVVEIAYSNFITGLYNRAVERYENKDYKGALEDIKLENLVRKNMHSEVEPFEKDIEAVNCLSKLIDLTEKISKNPEDYKLYYERALLFEKPKKSIFENESNYSFCSDYDGAIADYTKVLDLKPDFKEIYARRADVTGMSMNGVSFPVSEQAKYEKIFRAKYQKMIPDYEKAIALTVPSKDLHFKLAGAYLGDKQYEKALKKFHELTESDSLAYYGMAITYYALNDYKKTLESLHTFEEKFPNICDAVKKDCPDCPCPYTAYYQLRAKTNLRLLKLKDFVKDLKRAIKCINFDAPNQ